MKIPTAFMQLAGLFKFTRATIKRLTPGVSLENLVAIGSIIAIGKIILGDINQGVRYLSDDLLQFNRFAPRFVIRVKVY